MLAEEGVGKVAFVVCAYDCGDEALSSVEGYDSASDTWSEVALMRTSRHGHGVCDTSGELYASGGVREYVATATVEK